MVGMSVVHHSGAFTVILPICMFYADNEHVHRMGYGLLSYAVIASVMMIITSSRDIYDLKVCSFARCLGLLCARMSRNGVNVSLWIRNVDNFWWRICWTLSAWSIFDGSSCWVEFMDLFAINSRRCLWNGNCCSFSMSLWSNCLIAWIPCFVRLNFMPGCLPRNPLWGRRKRSPRSHWWGRPRFQWLWFGVVQHLFVEIDLWTIFIPIFKTKVDVDLVFLMFFTWFRHLFLMVFLCARCCFAVSGPFGYDSVIWISPHIDILPYWQSFYHSGNKLIISAVRFFIFINISKCIFAVRGCVPEDEWCLSHLPMFVLIEFMIGIGLVVSCVKIDAPISWDVDWFHSSHNQFEKHTKGIMNHYSGAHSESNSDWEIRRYWWNHSVLFARKWWVWWCLQDCTNYDCCLNRVHCSIFMVNHLQIPGQSPQRDYDVAIISQLKPTCRVHSINVFYSSENCGNSNAQWAITSVILLS